MKWLFILKRRKMKTEKLESETAETIQDLSESVMIARLEDWISQQ